MTGQVIPFNPLDKKNLGASVAEAMLARPVLPLSAVPRFTGAGIYAIYYTGHLPVYADLVAHNADGQFAAPIYVGKAVPAGARRGGAIANPQATRALHGRLTEHAESVAQATNLDAADFYCRFLVVDDIWIPLGESLLISKFSPVWNSFLDGFGNHDPGAGRYNGMCPRWDVLHPGRPWAVKCKQRPETAIDIEREVANYLRTAIFPKTQTLVSPNEGQPAT